MISVLFAPLDLLPEQGRGVGNGARKLRGERPADRRATAFVLLASGVGNKPEAISTVRSPNCGSGNNVPLRIIPERGQGPENVTDPANKQGSDVFHDDIAGSKLANEAGIFRPEAGSFAGYSGTLAREADVLAGESAADDIDLSDAMSGKGSHVFIAGNIRPVFRQHPLTEGVDFAERDGLEPARPLQP